MASQIVDKRSYWFLNWSSDTVIDLDKSESKDGTIVQGWSAHFDSGNNQTWRAESSGDGYFKLTNVATGTVLDLAGGESKNQTPIIGWHSHGGANQQWKFVQVSDRNAQTPSFVIVNRASGTVVDLYNGGSSNGTRIYGWGSDIDARNSHQRWIAIPAGTPL